MMTLHLVRLDYSSSFFVRRGNSYEMDGSLLKKGGKCFEVEGNEMRGLLLDGIEKLKMLELMHCYPS